MERSTCGCCNAQLLHVVSPLHIHKLCVLHVSLGNVSHVPILGRAKSSFIVHQMQHSSLIHLYYLKPNSYYVESEKYVAKNNIN